jgi:hypothetical protein
MIARAAAACLSFALPTAAVAQLSMPALTVLAMCGVDGPPLQARLDEFAAIGWRPPEDSARDAVARDLGVQEIALQGLLQAGDDLAARDARLAELVAAAGPWIDGADATRIVLTEPEGGTLQVVSDGATYVTCLLSAPVTAEELGAFLQWEAQSAEAVQATRSVFAGEYGSPITHVAFHPGTFGALEPRPVILLPPTAIGP